MEIWKAIKGYEGLYEVSNKGRVKSLSRKMWNGHSFWLSKEITLKGRSDKNKKHYLSVCLRKNRKSKTIYIHRLVAEAFIENTNNLSCVNHKDEDKFNNNLENLEWISFKDNLNYGTRNERSGKKRRKPFYGKNLTTGEVIRFERFVDAKTYGFDSGAIIRVMKGQVNAHKNHIFYRVNSVLEKGD